MSDEYNLSTYIAENWRKLLASEFPGTKFKVRATGTKNGGTTKISWIGPPAMELMDSMVRRMVPENAHPIAWVFPDWAWYDLCFPSGKVDTVTLERTGG
jgi:hypothetical protein